MALLQAPGGALVDACLSMFASMGAGFAEFEQAFRAGRGYGWDRRDATYWQGTDGLTRAMLPPAAVRSPIATATGNRGAARVASIGAAGSSPNPSESRSDAPNPANAQGWSGFGGLSCLPPPCVPP